MQEKGWRVPAHLFPPEVLPGTEQWLADFFELGTDRRMGMNGPGPIPAASLDRHTAGWPEDDAEVFRFVVREMDRAYLNSLRPDGDVPESDNPARDAFRAVMR